MRVSDLASWHADWRGLSAAVLGVGVSGFAAADTLAELGAKVTVYAPEETTPYAPLLEVIGAEYHAAPLDESLSITADLVIISPGIAPDNPLISRLRRAGVPIWSEIELAWRVRDKVNACPWLLVTGTNGKTTTTEMAVSMIAQAGLRVMACGNIGAPVLDAVRDPQGFDCLVVELSSFQLASLPAQGPGAVCGKAAACLNFADDHLQWHQGLEGYYAAKARVYEGVTDFCVYNRDDPATERMVRQAEVAEGARAIGFTLGAPDLSELGLVEGILCDRAFLENRSAQALELTSLDRLERRRLAMPHQVANILAAAALARSMGVEPADICAAMENFAPSGHRIETIAEQAGVQWVNDSKATNPHAAQASLAAFSSVVWIVGGVLKGVDLTELLAAAAGRARAILVIGKDQDFINGVELAAPVISVPDQPQIMREVVRQAALYAQPGDTVLLSPAAASFDQFKDYRDRGEQFTAAVKELLND